MIVYVLFHETNSGHSDESDGYVEAVYETEALADAARLRAIRDAVQEDKAVWYDPDDPDAEENTEWTDDWHVEAHEVQSILTVFDWPPPTSLTLPPLRAGRYSPLYPAL